ncbi:hypothetical protein [Tsukamurella sp. PLM1]|uniref:hypothetical protein n=1 Tax=Tsukamurella sp. PLM1 TaxID=2929795 RepID=UPI002058F80C|nr:hypothetical protein [Tsukamurella sp. PLM1]BDH55090.1 hypothetical protein MTP03_00290 [Tsukamurella sp. PLM1]
MATPALVDDAAPAPEAAAPAARPTNAQRLVSGLSQSVLGPANIARALSGLGLSLAGRALGALYRLVRSWISPAEVDPDRAITLSDDAASAGPAWRRPLLITLAVTLVLAIGGVAFKLLRTPSAPPVAPEPPRVRPASGATGDSAPLTSEEIDLEVATDGTVDEDPRKQGE